jgi:hypothetical protein
MGIAHPSVVPGYFDLRRPIAKNVAVLDDAALVRQCASRCVLPQQHPSCAESSPAAPRSQSARYPPRCRTREEAVARGLDQPTMMFRNLRVDHLSPDRPEPIEGALFVCPDQARISRHIGGKYRGKSPGRDHRYDSLRFSERASTRWAPHAARCALMRSASVGGKLRWAIFKS